MTDFRNLTLSDFYLMEIGTRQDGSVSPVIAYGEKGNAIGVPGYRGNPSCSDLEIKEEAFRHYQDVLQRLTELELQKIN